MKIFKDLFIHCANHNQSEDFVKRLLDLVGKSDKWCERDTTEETSDFLIFESKEGAVLFLHRKEDMYSVTNIVPTKKSSLSYDEYNDFLNDFYSEFIVQFEKELTVVISDDEVTLEKFLRENTSKALRLFSKAANKSTGSSHPYDKERWHNFIITSFVNHDLIASDVLKRWLVEEENWSEDAAVDLVIEYEQGISLLGAYSSTSGVSQS